MRYNFTREELDRARPTREPLYGVVLRKMAASAKFDETVSISGLADEETYHLVDAVLRWCIKRDEETRAELKRVVLAL